MCTLAVERSNAVYIWAMTAVNSDIARGWLHEADCRLADMVAIVEQPTELADYPHAAAVDHNTVVYDCDRSPLGDLRRRFALCRAG